MGSLILTDYNNVDKVVCIANNKSPYKIGKKYKIGVYEYEQFNFFGKKKKSKLEIRLYIDDSCDEHHRYILPEDQKRFEEIFHKSTQNIKYFSIAKDFSYTPGARYISEGDHSAELFLKSFLVLFKTIIDNDEQLIVDLDGTAGYATSFLEHTFSSLSRVFGADVVNNHLELKSEEQPFLIDEILEYIEKI